MEERDTQKLVMSSSPAHKEILNRTFCHMSLVYYFTVVANSNYNINSNKQGHKNALEAHNFMETFNVTKWIFFREFKIYFLVTYFFFP